MMKRDTFSKIGRSGASVEELSTTKLVELQPSDLGLALGLLAGAIALSLWLRLGLAWQMLIATGRMVVQLVVVGYLCWFVFAGNSLLGVGVAVVVLFALAVIQIRNQISKDFPHLLVWIAGPLGVSTLVTLLYGIGVVIRPTNGLDPRYVIPLAALMLSHSINVSTLAGDRFLRLVQQHQLDIETHLSLGATPQQAIAAYRQQAMKAGLTPTLNTLTTLGLVTIPTFMNGQFLGGINPLEAASYQILISLMFLFASVATLGLTLLGLSRLCFNAAAQLVWPNS
jgi:putative ABC transport system permease protein